MRLEWHKKRREDNSSRLKKPQVTTLAFATYGAAEVTVTVVVGMVKLLLMSNTYTVMS